MVNINTFTEPGLSSALSGGASPKGIYLIFLLNNASNYLLTMRTSRDEGTIEQVTAALIAFCPDRTTREGLWKRYTELIKGDSSIAGNSTVTASVMVVGDLIDYLNDTLEFTEKSTGGFL